MNELAVIAGPCSVESRDQLLTAARALATMGVDALRGGAYKPRTSPHSFQGLREEGLELLAEARAETGLPIVTEVMSPDAVERVAAVADYLQIGARNMANEPLLQEAARSGQPLILKRAYDATLDDLLPLVEAIRAEGAELILCERGQRGHEPSYRFDLEFEAVLALKRLTGLPVIVDPSHAAGRRDLVPSLMAAAAAIGADGLIVEVHPNPDEAQTDAAQQLDLPSFERALDLTRRVAAVTG